MYKSELVEAYCATTFAAQLPDGEIGIRIGQRHPRLDALLKERGVGTWAYITACNPGSADLPPDKNDKHSAELVRYLELKGYRFFLGEGRPYEPVWDPEASVLVIGIEHEAAIRLGQDLNQNAIVIGQYEGVAELVWLPAKPTILLVGTFHGYQMDMPGWNKKCGAPLFEQRISHIVSKSGVDYLFEELSVDALTNLSVRHESWLEVIARQTTIMHKFIDPGQEERLRIGIRPGEECTQEGIEKRERYWLERVRNCDFSTALCVIGADHVEKFSARLSQQYTCAVIDACYNPKNIEK